MRRRIALLIALTLALTAPALAEVDDPEIERFLDSLTLTLPADAVEPAAAANPQEHPDYSGLEDYSDGELDDIYDAMDIANDEAFTVDKYGGLTCTCDYVDAEGNTYDVNVTTLLDTEFGRVMVSSNAVEPGLTLYNAASATVACRDGEYLLTDPAVEADMLELTWTSFHFPYIPFDRFLATRSGAQGEYYVLALSTQGYLYEYVTDGMLHIIEIRRYIPDDDGDFIYNGHCTYAPSDAPLPQAVVDLLSAPKAASAPAGTASPMGESA